MKTLPPPPFWDRQVAPGHCKYDNIAVSDVYVDIKGGAVKPHLECIKIILFIGAAVLPPGASLRAGWREHDDAGLFALGVMAMMGWRRRGTV